MGHMLALVLSSGFSQVSELSLVVTDHKVGVFKVQLKLLIHNPALQHTLANCQLGSQIF